MFVFSAIVLHFAGKLSEGVYIDNGKSLIFAALIFAVSSIIMLMIFNTSGMFGFIISIIKNIIVLNIVTHFVKGFRIVDFRYYFSVALGITAVTFFLGLALGLLSASLQIRLY